MQAILVMFRSDGERRSFSIMRDMTVIGRREDCDLRIPLSDVSRKHCRLVRDGETLRLEDLGSSNGTYRNGERVQEAILSPGDTLQVGPVQFVLQIDGEPADDQLAPQEGVAAAESSYDATESSSVEPEAVSAYELPAELESADLAEHRSAADVLSDHATVDEPVIVEVTPPVAAARRQPPTPPPAPPAAAAAPSKKSNGVHAAPAPIPPAPAAETDEAPPFEGLDDSSEAVEEQDFFIIDEPNSSSQSGEIQIDMDSPPA
jgi:hypothetical protein